MANTGENEKAQDTPLAGAALKQKISQLWADTPEYVALLHDGKHSKVAPRLLASVAPAMPPDTPPGQTATVLVSLVIAENGRVEAARVVESSDAKFDQGALDAVLQWKFKPAEGEGGPVKSFSVVPIQFVSPAPEQTAIGLNVGPVTYRAAFGSVVSLDGSPPPKLQGTLNVAISLIQQGAADVKAGRTLVTLAKDDTGTKLKQPSVPEFYRSTVGSISEEDYRRVAAPSLDVSLSLPAPNAEKLETLEGTVELVIPRLDPKATARIEGLDLKIGSPLASPALSEAGVTVVVYDKASCDRYQAGKGSSIGGPQDYDVGSFFGKGLGSWMSSGASSQKEMTETDLAIGINDPEGRLVGLEFQAADGRPLHYNHNGWYHARDATGRRFSVYRLESKPAADTIMVCWLITPKALFKIPLKLADVPLPSRPPE
ncbi:MAG: energy transducer TonB [Opitutaceae bacterium]|nr:energy transducer TonB [Opitutaceae bacterium]